jgi:hypothetical protein
LGQRFVEIFVFIQVLPEAAREQGYRKNERKAAPYFEKKERDPSRSPQPPLAG